LVVSGPIHMFCWLMLAKCIWKWGIMQQSIYQVNQSTDTLFTQLFSIIDYQRIIVIFTF
jgi:hypothetical protein